MEDAKPRPDEALQAAIDCISNEIVRNPTAMAKNGDPLMIHYIVIREVLIAELARRKGECHAT